MSLNASLSKGVAASFSQYLRRDGVRPRGEELGDASRVEPVLGEPDRRTEPRAAGSHHDRVIRVIHHRVRRRGGGEEPSGGGDGGGGGGALALGEAPEATRDAAAPHLGWISVHRTPAMEIGGTRGGGGGGGGGGRGRRGRRRGGRVVEGKVVYSREGRVLMGRLCPRY